MVVVPAPQSVDASLSLSLGAPDEANKSDIVTRPGRGATSL